MTQTTTLSASAWAEDVEAVGDAIASAVDTIDAPPALVLLFPDDSMPALSVLARAASAAPGAAVAGMTSDGLITREGVRSAGCGVAVFGPELAVGVGVAHDASDDVYAAGRAAAQAAVGDVDLRPGHAVLLLFVDPRSGDEAAAIDGAYSVVGGRIPLAGGGANGPDPCVLAGDTVSRDAVVAIALASPEPVAVGIAHGCRPRSSPAIATRTEGRAVLELNGRPAEEVYLEGLGRSGPPLDDDTFESLAVLHPLGQPELRGLLRLRHVRGRAEGGGLACATAIPANAAVWFTEQTVQTIVESAAGAVGTTLDLLPTAPRAALVFDCAARKRALGARASEEVDALLEAFGGAPVTGLYTRGEVGRTRGAKGDRNHAVVVVAFA
ncbi:MAG TPA: FIST N-terminal domain-containing protein [Solirubrobacteraceae bacterium]|nr:FIST N-terminal domain-containing protein [Solirubrobacteraceae bacterium]